LFKNEDLCGLVKNVFEVNKAYFFKEPASKVKHQNYTGGLADHTALVTLVAFDVAETHEYMKVKTDDAMIAALFHDWEKIGMYDRTNPKLVKNDDEIVNFLRKKRIITSDNPSVVNGIIYAHGGWTTRPGNHLPIAIIVHFADMAASQNIKKKPETRNQIEIIKESISKFSNNHSQVSSETIDVES
jgi:23S rRNA maturation-related 3'-5' exoribonuclease YhaM